MMPPPDEPARCYKPGCQTAPGWMVTDTTGENGRDACAEHMPRLVYRLNRKISGPVVVAPRFVVDHASELVDLLVVGATVYGLVNDPVGAQAASQMSAEVRATMRQALGGPAAALSSTESGDQVTPGLILPGPGFKA